MTPEARPLVRKTLSLFLLALLAVSALIACQEASRIHADALTWIPPLTSYKRLEIEQIVVMQPFTHRHTGGLLTEVDMQVAVNEPVVFFMEADAVLLGAPEQQHRA